MKIVNGVVYDARLATTVVSWRETEHVQGVPTDVVHTLYRRCVLKPGLTWTDVANVSSWGSVSMKADCIDKRAGDFFLVTAVGGSLSYSDTGSRVIAISYDEATKLVEIHGSYDTYTEFFGEPISAAIIDMLKAHAALKKTAEQNSPQS